MAFLPCDRGHPNLRGRNTLIYSAYGSGQDFTRFRLRLCVPHASLVWQNLAQFKVSAADSTDPIAPNNNLCIACGQPVLEEGWQVFATAYPAHDQREDYWAKLHANCRFPDWLLNTGDNGHLPDIGSVGAVTHPMP